jgi:hypothetical protein
LAPVAGTARVGTGTVWRISNELDVRAADATPGRGTLGGGSLNDGRDVAGGETPIRDALRALVEDTTASSHDLHIADKVSVAH